MEKLFRILVQRFVFAGAIGFIIALVGMHLRLVLWRTNNELSMSSFKLLVRQRSYQGAYQQWLKLTLIV